MKNNATLPTVKRQFLFTLLSLLMFSFTTQAQTFWNPASNEDTYPIAGSPDIGTTTHTSCYSVSNMGFYGSSEDLVVSGWDDVGTPSGVAWRRLATGSFGSVIIAQGIIPYANVQDLEVGILQSGAGWEIYVAYYLGGTGHMLDVYDWNPGGVTLLYSIPLSATPVYGRISMDCHKLYGLALVWEDNGIHSMTGLSGSPTTTYGGDVLLNGTNGYSVPDVAFTHTGSGLNVHYVYLNQAGGYLEESYYDYFALMSAPSGSTILQMVEDQNFFSNERRYAYPNMDAPDHYSKDNWAYTYTLDNQNISVRLVDYFSSIFPVTRVVNDNSILPSAPINSSNNMAPFLSYDHHMTSMASINVGWYSTQMNPMTGMAASYVHLQMDQYGTGLVAMPPDYHAIPNNPGNTSNTPVLSFSKQNEMCDYLYTVFPEMGYQMQHKYHPWSTSPFKSTETAAINTECEHDARIEELRKAKASVKLAAYPNPFTDRLSLAIPAELQTEKANVRIVDVMGKQVGSYNGMLLQANNYLADISQTLPPGTYLLTVDAGNTCRETIKVTKSK